MRAVGSSTLKVNQAVSTKDAQGVWTYNWGASDLDTDGDYLVWVTVDMGGGAIQTVNEAVITVAAHEAGLHAYLELEEPKSVLDVTSSHAESEMRRAVISASRAVDEVTQTRFWTTTSDEIRYYTPLHWNKLHPHEINSLTELATDDSGGTTFGTVWTANTDYVLYPLNA